MYRASLKHNIQFYPTLSVAEIVLDGFYYDVCQPPSN
jgi:hypothetical protein